MHGPLNGYRVIDLTAILAGPSTTGVLADQGADVIKIEPLGGDFFRFAGPRRGGMGSVFMSYNRNKKSVALDLKEPKALAALLNLVGTADIFVQNFRPGVADRLGLSEAALRALNPELIYVSISGYGETGPYAHRPGLDPAMQGLSGMAYGQAGDDGRPRLVRSPIVDKISGFVVSQAVTAALCERERTGRARSVQVAMLDLAVAFAWPDVMGREMFVGGCAPAAVLGDGEWLHPTKDGFIIAMPVSDEHFDTLVRLSGRSDWFDDPDFKDTALRFRHRSKLGVAMRTAFLGRTTAEWERLLDEADIPFAQVLRPDQVADDPQVRHNAVLVKREHPAAGLIREARTPARFDHEPLPLRGHAPTVGEHNAEILGSLGYSEDEIAEMVGPGAKSRGGRMLGKMTAEDAG